MLDSPVVVWLFIFLIAGIIFGLVPFLVRYFTRGKYRIRRIAFFGFLLLTAIIVLLVYERLFKGDSGPDFPRPGRAYGLLLALWIGSGLSMVTKTDKYTLILLQEAYRRWKTSEDIEDLEDLLMCLDTIQIKTLIKDRNRGAMLLEAQTAYIAALETGKHRPVSLEDYYWLGYLYEMGVGIEPNKQLAAATYEKALTCPRREDDGQKEYNSRRKEIERRLKQLKHR